MNLVSTVGLRVVYDERAMDPGAGTDSGEGWGIQSLRRMVTEVGAYSKVTT